MGVYLLRESTQHCVGERKGSLWFCIACQQREDVPYTDACFCFSALTVQLTRR